MSEQNEVEKKENPLPPKGGRRGGKKVRYGWEFKLKAVQLHLREGYSQQMVADELGVARHTVMGWVSRYQAQGEAGLQDRTGGSTEPKLPPAITQKIVEVKTQNPSWGIQRISHWLRRFLLLPASPETVRQKLHQAGLIDPAPPPRARNVTRPRFFERATPNQMWQTDIFTFRLGGRYAYVITFLDDYSRFVVGADLFRSPTAEAVIEVYRRAISEFNPPREMLTDNGRQYTNWRGVSRFEAELKKDRVAHFKSRPHHPMTLGKVERFWATLWQEFLTRSQFESFEVARERIKLWIQYYNHKRPHQGIEGLCPADRFFEIQSELRQTIEAGIKDNLLELALRGQPTAPFYMVGRMEGQSVVLRAEKGKLKLSVSDDHNQNTHELTYDLHQTGKARQDSQTQPASDGAAESPGRPGGLDRALQAGGGVPSVGHQLGDLSSVAKAGDDGHAPGSGEPDQPGSGRGVEPAIAGPVAAACHHPGQAPAAAGASSGEGSHELNDNRVGASATTSSNDPSSAGGSTDRHAGSGTTGDLPQELLPVGTTSPGGTAPEPGEAPDRASSPASRSDLPPAATADPQTGTAAPESPAPGQTTGPSPAAGTTGGQ
jgi:transposase InsO family protein